MRISDWSSDLCSSDLKAGRQERMMRGLAGKSVLVTGGGSGIGRAAALLLGEGGCRLLIADLSQDAADRVCAEVIGNGGEARAFHGDVGSAEDVRAMVDAAVSAFGGLQGAVNAAGVPQVGTLLPDVATGEWER